MKGQLPTNVQLATNRQGEPAYGFLLKDQAGTLKVISLGQIEVREGDQVIVKVVFSRLRQAGNDHHLQRNQSPLDQADESAQPRPSWLI